MHDRLLIRLDAASHRDSLLGFLGERGCSAEAADERTLAVDDCMGRNPGVATLVALVDEWRSSAHALEAVLEVGERRTVLRTET